MFRNYTLLLIFCLSPSAIGQADYSADELLDLLFNKVENIETVSYDFKQSERLRDAWNNATVFTKISYDPKQIYFKTLKPDEGIEILWKDKSPNECLVYPNFFPYLSISLNPKGRFLLGAHQHYPLYEAGFEKVVQVLKHLKDKYQNSPHRVFHIAGETVFDQKEVFILEFNAPEFELLEYQVKEGENLLDIANKQNLNPYFIFLLNEELNNYFDLSTGDIIKIPSDFSRKTIMYIDKINFLPIYQKVLDQNLQLLEQYEYLDLKLNVEYPEDDFDSNNSKYNF